jgi:hypothetical protein
VIGSMEAVRRDEGGKGPHLRSLTPADFRPWLVCAFQAIPLRWGAP